MIMHNQLFAYFVGIWRELTCFNNGGYDSVNANYGILCESN